MNFLPLLLFFALVLVPAVGQSQTGAIGSDTGGTGSPAGGGGTSVNGGGTDTGSGGLSDPSGGFTDPDRRSPETPMEPRDDQAGPGQIGFPQGDAAPRPQPQRQEDPFNTAPRIPPEPGFPDTGSDLEPFGGGGTTSEEIDGRDTEINGTGGMDMESGAGRGGLDAVPDRDTTREPNGTEGSRSTLE